MIIGILIIFLQIWHFIGLGKTSNLDKLGSPIFSINEYYEMGLGIFGVDTDNGDSILKVPSG
jgi:hypothetical protein